MKVHIKLGENKMDKNTLPLKTYKTIDEQIEYLKENKKIIIPKEYRYTLIEQNYVSLINAYKVFFVQGIAGPKKEHVYKEYITIDKLLDIYEVDKNIEQMLYELIGAFERHFKNVLIHEICMKYTENCNQQKAKDIYCISYLTEIKKFFETIKKYDSFDSLFEELNLKINDENFKKELCIPRFCTNIFSELKHEKYTLNQNLFSTRYSLLEKLYFYGGGTYPDSQSSYESKNELIKHYIKTQKFVPMWVLPNALTFGELQILFTMLDSTSQKQIISQLLYYDLDRIRIKDINIFSSYLETIRNLRNIVNHYEPIIPYFISKIPDKKIKESHIAKTLKLLLKDFYRNKNETKTKLYPMPLLIDNRYNTRKIKVVTTIYNILYFQKN